MEEIALVIKGRRVDSQSQVSNDGLGRPHSPSPRSRHRMQTTVPGQLLSQHVSADGLRVMQLAGLGTSAVGWLCESHVERFNRSARS